MRSIFALLVLPLAAACDPMPVEDRDAGIAIDPLCVVTEPPACEPPELHYTDIMPILNERCIVCHDGLHEQWPLTTYYHVADWHNEIRGAMLGCTMPPKDAGVTMTIEEREQLLRWLRCGYLK